MKTILVQAGHLAPRQPGHESQTGTGGEIDLVTRIRDQLVSLLAADGRFTVLAMPGYIPHGIKCDAALFLHADGSVNPATSGYTFGYPAGYAVNKKLADLIDKRFRQIPHPAKRGRDNYTRDLAGYYGFGTVDTPGPEVLVEHGFLTNPQERAWLTTHTHQLANAQYLALLDYFAMTPPVPKPAPARPPVAAQHEPPWHAHVGTRLIATGRLIDATFVRAIATELRAGHTVTLTP